jgi:FkbM family methyltransferase
LTSFADRATREKERVSDIDHTSSGFLSLNQTAQARLARLLDLPVSKPAVDEVQFARPPQKVWPQIRKRNLTLVLSANEINRGHGTGILTHRLLKDTPNVAVLRAATHYDGSCLFDGLDLVLPESAATPEGAYQIALDWFSRDQIERAICVPWSATELQMAVALKRIYRMSLILYIMDDNCLHTGRIPAQLMEEAIDVADIRFAISPEMQNAYQDRFRKKFWILPPLVNPASVSMDALTADDLPEDKRAIIIGNIWSQESLDLLCKVIHESGVEIDWYCNTRSPGWLHLDLRRLFAAGIFLQDPLPEAELALILRRRAFAILPSGTLDEKDSRPNVSRYSLPSRLLFTTICGVTPTIVLGAETTAAGAFVRHFAVGTVADYSGRSLRRAIEQVTAQSFRNQFRYSVGRIAENFSAAGMSDWIFKAAETGLPPDERFERLLNYRRKEFGYYISPPAPKHVFFNFREAYESLRRLKFRGLKPDFILDVGSSTGCWSYNISSLFPDARYILIDPLISYYPAEEVDAHVRRIATCELLEMGVSNVEGSQEIEIANNLYQSSFISIETTGAPVRKIRVPVATLDRISKEKAVLGRGLIKIDVQYAEHLVIEGAMTLLASAIDCVIIELSIERLTPETKTLSEMVTKLDQLGFRWVDNAGEWRSTEDGQLEQIDVVFVRKEFAKPTSTQN